LAAAFLAGAFLAALPAPAPRAADFDALLVADLAADFFAVAFFAPAADFFAVAIASPGRGVQRARGN
jgi:hypothetical protein